jgi:D-lactate dehydrogenase
MGTGKIGSARCRICLGFGMRVIAYDIHKNPSLEKYVEYVSLDALYKSSDLISLHCPLTSENRHMINAETINKMRDGVILVNTSRGALINTTDLIKGIKNGKFQGVGLDVYEEEVGDIYYDHSSSLFPNPAASRLMDYPNVVMTSHQGFYTKEALHSIAETTLQNAYDVMSNTRTTNDIA